MGARSKSKSKRTKAKIVPLVYPEIVSPQENYVVDVFVWFDGINTHHSIEVAVKSELVGGNPPDIVVARCYPDETHPIDPTRPDNSAVELFQSFFDPTEFSGTVEEAECVNGPPAALPPFKLAVWDGVFDPLYWGDWDKATWRGVDQINYGHCQPNIPFPLIKYLGARQAATVRPVHSNGRKRKR